MGMWDKFRQSGGGVQEKSSAWNPFVSHTIAEVKNKPQVVRDGQTRAQLPGVESEKSGIAGSMRAAYHSTEVKKWNLELAPSMKKKGSDNFVQTLSNKDAYLKVVLNDTYFSRDTGSRLDREALAGVLRATQSSLPRSADAPAEIAGAELVVLAQAAALASRYCPDGTENPVAIADAARGLACLQNLDLFAAIRDPAKNATPPRNGSPDKLVVNCPRGIGIGAGATAGSAIGHDSDQFDSNDVACAWRIASVLEATPLGFATLKKLTRSNPPPHPVHPSVEKHDDVMLHVYLQATREKMKEARAENRTMTPDPRELDCHLGSGNVANLAGPAELTLLDKALLAARAHLVASNEHAHDPATADKPFRFTPDANAGPVHEWAVAAVRNGIYSDKRVDEHGQLTQFGKIEEQLEKMDLWVNRASGRNDDGTPETKWDRVKRGVTQFFLPRHYRSPLNAYKRLAPGIKKKSGVSIGNPEEGGVGDGREFRDSLIQNLEKGLKEYGGSNWLYSDRDVHGDEQKGEDAWRPENRRAVLFGNSEDGSRKIIQVDQERPDLRVLKSAARLAILEQFREETVFLPRYLHGDKLDDGALDKALERVSGFLDGGLESQSDIVQADVRSYLRSENRPLTPELLVEWAADLGGPKTIDDAVKLASGDSPQPISPLEPNKPDWRAFGKAMDRVVNGNVDRVETKPLTGLPKDEIGAIFEELLQHEELGSTTTLASGGTSGVGLSGLVGSVFTYFHAATLWLLRPSARADFRANKHDTMTIGPNPEGTELFLGKQKVKLFAGGANVAVGPGFDVGEGVGAAAGLSTGGGVSLERETREGVTIRFPRMDTGVAGEVKEGLDIDPENNEKLGRLTRKLINQCKEPEGSPKGYINAPGEEDSKSLLKNIWQEWPEVSINYADVKDKRHGHNWNVGLGGGFAFGPLRGGLGPVAERVTTHSDLQSIETGGALHVDTYNAGTIKKVRVGWSVGFTAVKSVFKKIGAGIAGGDVNLAQSVPGVELAGASATIHRKGTAERFTWIKQDGELKKESYRQVTHQDADSFVESVKPDIDIWAEAKAFKFSKKKFHASTFSKNSSPLSPAEATRQLIERAAAIGTEYRKTSEHLQSSKDNPDSTKNFLRFYEIRDDALKTANDLDSVADMAWKAGDKATAEECTKTRDNLLRNEHSYEPAFLVDVQVGYERKTKGVNLLLIRQQEDVIVRTNLHTFT